MWGNIVAIHSVLKKTMKQNSQPAQYKKIKSTKIILGKKRKKFIKRKKKPCRATL
jgi:hypothetical protein